MRPQHGDRIDKARVMGLVMMRNLKALAKRSELDEDKILLIAERQFRLCRMCQLAFTLPTIFRLGLTGPPRAILCRNCARALARCNEHPVQLLKHFRFKGRKRSRLARYYDMLVMPGPFEVEDMIDPEPPSEMTEELARNPRALFANRVFTKKPTTP